MINNKSGIKPNQARKPSPKEAKLNERISPEIIAKAILFSGWFKRNEIKRFIL